jgi:hypothetical protein
LQTGDILVVAGSADIEAGREWSSLYTEDANILLQVGQSYDVLYDPELQDLNPDLREQYFDY